MTEFLLDKHLEFIKSLDARIKKLDYWQAHYLRMSGIYWALTALLLLEPELDPTSSEFDEKSPLSREDIIKFVIACQCPKGGFSGNIGHDAHLTFTLSAIQIMFLLNAMESIDIDRHVTWISYRQKADGSFEGDEHGEVDTRFSYCSVAALSLLNRLEAINLDKAKSFVESCRNYDGGFGSLPDGESHSGQVFCCVGFKAILGDINACEGTLSEWLSWRQLPCGGLNGRPEKLEDVCYSWWVLSSLSILGKLTWINTDALQKFILNCQDPVTGGFSDRPGDISDIFHTLFAVAGLSLLQFPGLALVDPRFCLPFRFTTHLL